jgi:hypothetical protein
MNDPITDLIENAALAAFTRKDWTEAARLARRVSQRHQAAKRPSRAAEWQIMAENWDARSDSER